MTAYDDAAQTLARYAGGVPKQGPKPTRKGKTRKILCISDLHVPFCRLDLLGQVLSEEGDADLCVINGDVSDGYAISRFIKYEHHPYLDELQASKAVLEKIAAVFPQVILIDGNHDGPRLEKQLRTLLPIDLIQAVEFLAGGVLSPIHALAKTQHITIASWKAHDREMGWLHVEGDAIFTHAEKFYSVPGRCTQEVLKWLDRYQSTLGLPRARLVVQGHTHQLSWVPVDGDRLAVESGCLCEVPGYALSAKLGGLPQTPGYVTFTQTDGLTDLRSVRCQWLV